MDNTPCKIMALIVTPRSAWRHPVSLSQLTGTQFIAASGEAQPQCPVSCCDDRCAFLTLSWRVLGALALLRRIAGTFAPHAAATTRCPITPWRQVTSHGDDTRGRHQHDPCRHHSPGTESSGAFSGTYSTSSSTRQPKYAQSRPRFSVLVL